MLWLGAISLIPLFTIPETLPSQVLFNKAKRLRRLGLAGYENVRAPVEATDRTLSGLYKVALTRPWKIAVDPIAVAVNITVAVVYLLVYMLFTIYPIIFIQKRGYNSGVGELPLIGVVLGAAIGGVVVFYITSRDRKRLERGHEAKPEDRLPVAMIGGVVLPLSMFWFAWSGEYNYVHWIVPTIAGVFLSASIMLIFVAYLNYLAGTLIMIVFAEWTLTSSDVYLMYAASAIAANTVIRSAAAAAGPLFTQYMFNALGVGGGGSLIAGVALLLAVRSSLKSVDQSLTCLDHPVRILQVRSQTSRTFQICSDGTRQACIRKQERVRISH